MILISSLGYLSSVLISRFQIHFNGCPFFRVHIRGKRKECGNYLDHDVSEAKAVAEDMLKVLDNYSEKDLMYREEE
jgi:hypothetical protein